MRRFDVKATDRKLDQYWSSLSNTISSFEGAANILSNPNLDNGSTGFTPSNGSIINFVTNAEGNNVFRIRPAGVAIAIRSTSVQVTQQFEEWYFECRVRTVVPVTTTGFVVITAEVFTDGASAASATISSSAVTASTLTSEWTTISGVYTVAAARNGIRFRLYLDGTITDGEIEVDNFVMKRKDGVSIVGQVAGSNIGNISSSSNLLSNNRNITSDSPTSILLKEQATAAVTKPLSDFGFSFLLYPYVSDVWLISWNYQNTQIGIKMNSDSTMSLIWPEDNVIVEKKIPYTEQASYCVFSRNGSVVSLLLNNETVSVINDSFELGNITFGGGTGMALVDRIALSIAGSLPTAYEYADLFKSQRLDTAPRPDGASSFAYLTDVMTPDVITLMKADFGFSEDYYYASVQNVRDYGVFSIERSATFPVEYSLDAGETWANLPGKLRLSEVYESVLFRHQTNTEHEYWIDVTTTYDSQIVLSDFNAKLNGIYHLPNANGRGYYDADSGFMGLASLDIDGQESAKVRSIEVLASFESDPTSMLQTFIDTYKSVYSASYQLQPSAATVTTYVNGQPRALSTLKLNQMYHIVFVLSEPVEYASINKAKTIGINLVGIGASNVAYSASDAFYLFCTFAGNTFISSLETVARVSDGSHRNSPTNQAGVVLDLQWNG